MFTEQVLICELLRNKIIIYPTYIYDKIKKMGLDYVPSTFNNSIAAGITAPKNVNTAIVMAICINPLP